MSTIEEIKLHKNKETQRFLCTVLYRNTNHLVLSFHSDKEGKIKDIIISKGSTTIAHYWTGRGYVLWRMFEPDKSLIGTLFHICRDVTITEQYVRYLDLIIDIWISVDGSLRILDEDELEGCKKSGLVSDEESCWIEEQKKLILNSYNEIIKDL